MRNTLEQTSILLIISGGIAAYKSLELIRLIKKAGGTVRTILTQGGAQFVTPLSVSALCEHEVYTDLWSLKDESEMGHIRLSREADLIVIAPASADIIAKMAHGLTPDLASTTLLAADKPALIAPAMNVKMWENPATQDNITKLKNFGHTILGPEEGAMACGEFGMGRMIEPETIFNAILEAAKKKRTPSSTLKRTLAGKTALVTSGPTHEPIDPVRYIGNHSSGKQGHTIACALRDAGANVTLITGPVNLPDPHGLNTIHITSAQDMLDACEKTLPADIAVCAAAVADWRIKTPASQKIKKTDSNTPPSLEFTQNPDILHTLSNHKNRPALVIGFAAETENLIDNAKAKRTQKGCDWILANNVKEENTFGSDENHVFLITQTHEQEWPKATKTEIAQTLINHIEEHLDHEHSNAAE